MAQTGAKSKKSIKKARQEKRQGLAVIKQKSQPMATRYQQRMGGLLREAVLLFAAAITIFLLASVLTFDVSDPGWSSTGGQTDIHNMFGLPGAWFADVLLSLFGIFGFITPFVVLYCGWLVYIRLKTRPNNAFLRVIRSISLVLWLLSGCGLAALLLGDAGQLPYGGGGILGAETCAMLGNALNDVGILLLLFTLFIVSLSVGLGFSWLELAEKTGQGVYWLFSSGFRDFIQNRIARYQDGKAAKQVEKQLEKTPDVAEETELLSEKQRLKAEKKAAKLAAKQAKQAKKQEKAAAKQDKPQAPALSAIQQPTSKVRVMPALGKETQAIKAPAKQRPSLSSGTATSVSALAKQKQAPTVEFNPETDSPLPPTNLLDPPRESQKVTAEDEAKLQQMAEELEQHLADFNVQAKVVAVLPGPVITRFEVDPAPGVKVSQITNLSKDLARSLATTSVRVVEVLPGKSVIGLEIPNKHRDIVSLRAVLESDLYQNSKSPLTLGLGHDIAGQPVIADLTKMPHLLVAGTTGSGKSVAVNAMILSMLHQATAKQVRMILVDPKMLELSVYEGIPHLLAPVVTDMKEAANALRWSVGEMERRYKLMAALGVRSMAGFNDKVQAAIDAGQPIIDPIAEKAQTAAEAEAGEVLPTLEPMPAIVIIIDELADLMMVVGKKVEQLIARLAQKARAAGIHMILATQRPSVDVITGLIKANIPTRMAFQVASRVDSRTILDQQGAESLLGHGDMLYLPPGTGFSQRVHGAFVDDHEVHHVVEYLKQVETPEYIDEILDGGTVGGDEAGTAGGDAEADPLYDQAVAVVTQSRKASISYVQRRLRVGYNRAARLVEQMENAGVVSSGEGGGRREVLAPPPPSDD